MLSYLFSPYNANVLCMVSVAGVQKMINMAKSENDQHLNLWLLMKKESDQHQKMINMVNSENDHHI